MARHRKRTNPRPRIVGGLVTAAGAAVVTAWAALPSTGAPAPAPTEPYSPASAVASEQPSVQLSRDAVGGGESYVAAATGFAPGEPVTWRWTGPTEGTMGTWPADGTGRAAPPSPIVERDPAGAYQIIAVGQSSGHVGTAPLQVLPAR